VLIKFVIVNNVLLYYLMSLISGIVVIHSEFIKYIKY